MKNDKKIVVWLKGEIENGEVFEQTPEDHPLLLVLGQSTIFPKVEEALATMQPGEVQSIRLDPEDAYGPHHQDLVQTLPAENFPHNIQPTPGMVLSLAVERDGKQEKIPATVIATGNDSVTIDFNHPLAGKPVIYTVKLHNILD